MKERRDNVNRFADTLLGEQLFFFLLLYCSEVHLVHVRVFCGCVNVWHALYKRESVCVCVCVCVCVKLLK